MVRIMNSTNDSCYEVGGSDFYSPKAWHVMTAEERKVYQAPAIEECLKQLKQPEPCTPVRNISLRMSYSEELWCAGGY